MGRSTREMASIQGQLPVVESNSQGEQQRNRLVPLLLRPGEAAAALGVGRTTVYELMRLGVLPAVHIGRAVRIPVHAVIDFVERQTGSHDPDRPAPIKPSARR